MGFIASCCSSINRETNREWWCSVPYTSCWSCLEFSTLNSIVPVIIQWKKFHVIQQDIPTHAGTLNMTATANSQGVVHFNHGCSYAYSKSLQKNLSSPQSIIYSSIHVVGCSPEHSKPEGPVAIIVQSSYYGWSINLCHSKLYKV